MVKLRAVVVDDEPLAREGIAQLARSDPEVEVVAECTSGRDAVSKIRSLSPDLVFLDVQMPEMSGFDVLSALPRLPAVVFVTAHDKYAVRAFETQAIDYLLKPFSDARFHKALGRAKLQIEQNALEAQNLRLRALLETHRAQSSGASAAGSNWLARIMIKSAGRISFVRTDEIDFIEAADYYVILHVGGKSHLLRESITDLESKLDPQQFARIHRSTVVNIARIREMRTQRAGECSVCLIDGTILKLSRRRREAVQAILKSLH